MVGKHLVLLCQKAIIWGFSGVFHYPPFHSISKVNSTQAWASKTLKALYANRGTVLKAPLDLLESHNVRTTSEKKCQVRRIIQPHGSVFSI